MEDFDHGDPQEVQHETQVENRTRRPESFLASWLKFERRQEGDQPENQPHSLSRTQKLLGSVFGGIVEAKPRSNPESEERTESADARDAERQEDKPEIVLEQAHSAGDEEGLLVIDHEAAKSQPKQATPEQAPTVPSVQPERAPEPSEYEPPVPPVEWHERPYEMNESEPWQQPQPFESGNRQPETQAGTPVGAPSAESYVPPASETETSTEEQSAKPEEVLYKVEEAAEHNVPLEAAYERRHEVKDDQATGPVKQQTDESQTDDVTPQSPADPAMYNQPGYAKTPFDPDLQYTPPTDGTGEPQMYRKALLAGFVTGLAVLVVLLLRNL